MSEELPNATHRTVLDSDSQHLGRVYAEALHAAALGRGRADETLADLEAVTDEAFAALPDLEAYLGSHAVPPEAKAEALGKAFGGKLGDLTLDFLGVMNRHGRLDHLRAVADHYRKMRDDAAGRERILVRSAVALTDAEKERLLAQLRADLGREPVLSAAVDPGLLGGLVVQVGDRVYDGSVKARLETIRTQLLAGSSHAIQRGRDRFSTAV